MLASLWRQRHAQNRQNKFELKDNVPPMKANKL
jgi:hypothetical protein